MTQITCQLPGGYIDDTGSLHQQVELLPLSGREEELLTQRRESVSASLVTEILVRCVQCIGSIGSVSTDILRHLLVADRQFLLLKLREATFGDRVQATVSCPWQNCREKIDIDFSTKDIPIKESEDKGPMYTMELSSKAALMDDCGKKCRKVSFRLPNGADQETISPLLAENEARALSMLLSRCVLSIGTKEKPGEKILNGLSPLARMEIENAIEAAAPKIELTIAADCPECGNKFTLPFDIQNFFFGEFKTSRDLLYREVHYLAYHYHWSEREIMDMPKEKRLQYINVLANEIERMNNAV